MILAPSVLSLDYSQFNEQIEILNRSVEWLHFDVMDGHFVPNLSFGPDIHKTFRKNTSLFMDTHLMVSDPDYFSDIFIDAGADQITFHYEVFNNTEGCMKLIRKIRNKYIKVGLSIKPDTPVSAIEELLPYLDTVLVMSVEPGYGGQKFISDAHFKIRDLRKLKEENSYHYLIEVDGGVNGQNARSILEDGADVLVAGSFVFKGDMNANIEVLRNADI